MIGWFTKLAKRGRGYVRFDGVTDDGRRVTLYFPRAAWELVGKPKAGIVEFTPEQEEQK